VLAASYRLLTSQTLFHSLLGLWHLPHLSCSHQVISCFLLYTHSPRSEPVVLTLSLLTVSAITLLKVHMHLWLVAELHWSQISIFKLRGQGLLWHSWCDPVIWKFLVAEFSSLALGSLPPLNFMLILHLVVSTIQCPLVPSRCVSVMSV
jgi:hypothetical protein